MRRHRVYSVLRPRAAKVSYNRPIDTREHDPQSFPVQRRVPRWCGGSRPTAMTCKYISGVDTERHAADLVGGTEAEGVPLGRPRRILVGRATRQRRGGAQRRRQPRLLPAATRCTGRRAGSRASTAAAHGYRTLVELQGHARRHQARSRGRRLDRHVARHALRLPVADGGPAGKQRDRHDLDGQRGHTGDHRAGLDGRACRSGTRASPRAAIGVRDAGTNTSRL